MFNLNRIAKLSEVILWVAIIITLFSSNAYAASSVALDVDFTNNVGDGADGTVLTIKIQPDEKILVGGYFTNFDNIPQGGIARLNSNGSLDTTPFASNTGTGFDAGVTTIDLQSDGMIVVGGYFLNFDANVSNYIARLDIDGDFDNSFTTSIGTGFDGPVTKIIVQPDDKIIVSGTFTNFNGVTQGGLTRLNSDGTIDVAFASNIGIGFDSSVDQIALQPDGKIIVSGFFANLNSIPQGYLVRLNSDGTVDTTFASNIGSGPDLVFNTISLDNSDRILLSGDHSTFNGVSQNKITRLDPDGTLDAGFFSTTTTGFDRPFIRLIPQSDGKTIGIGGFSPVYNFFRINSDGTFDSGYIATTTTGFNATAVTMEVDNNGKFVIGGGFNNFRGTTTNAIARVEVTAQSVPSAPTAVTAVAGNGSSTVTVSPPASDGGSVVLYNTATTTPGNFVATSATPYITFTGLTNGISYTISAAAVNAVGVGASAVSNSVTPTDGTVVITDVTPRRSSSGGGTPTYDGYITRASKYGQSGKYVTALQEALIKLKYASSTDIASDKGKFGDVTIASLKRFQAKYPKSLAMPTPTGKLDSRTVRKLNSLYDLAIKKSDPKRPSMKFTRFITTLGTIGPDVTALQKFLNNNGFIVMPVGEGSPGREGKYFGPATSAALKKWQIKNNLYPTGILDRLSVDRMNGM